jgi:hypothetical protein
VTLAADPFGAIPSSTRWLRWIGGSSERSSIVLPFSRARNMMYTVAVPRVRFAAVNASRSEIPSRPGLAFNAATEETFPLTASDVFVTTTTLLDIIAALEPAARAIEATAHTSPSTIAIAAATFNLRKGLSINTPPEAATPRQRHIGDRTERRCGNYACKAHAPASDGARRQRSLPRSRLEAAVQPIGCAPEHDQHSGQLERRRRRFVARASATALTR